jgi:hypothetical protein
MAIAKKTALEELFLDKAEIRRYLNEHGITTYLWEDPTATAQKACELMRASGIRPEDNEFSRAIIAARKS